MKTEIIGLRLPRLRARKPQANSRAIFSGEAGSVVASLRALRRIEGSWQSPSFVISSSFLNFVFRYCLEFRYSNLGFKRVGEPTLLFFVFK
jgi:hypothetical protein